VLQIIITHERILVTVLSRPCAMVVPDFELICEIMLVAEGFLEARLLARKFITLYSLCKELLSKQVLPAISRHNNFSIFTRDGRMLRAS